MDELDKARGALALENLDLPPDLPVDAIEPELYVDSDGIDSLLIMVVLSESVRDDDIAGGNVMKIHSEIREALLNAGVRLFPYIRIARRSSVQPETRGK